MAMTRILVVDDDSALQRLLAAAMRADGYEVLQAGDGLEALDLHARSPADLLILDIVMPNIDGYEVIRRLRDLGDPVPVLFLSGLTELKDRLHGFSLGGDDYISKPFSLNELRLRVKALLRRSMTSAPDPCACSF
jgi:two-component system OmpR family response regulator